LDSASFHHEGTMENILTILRIALVSYHIWHNKPNHFKIHFIKSSYPIPTPTFITLLMHHSLLLTRRCFLFNPLHVPINRLLVTYTKTTSMPTPTTNPVLLFRFCTAVFFASS
jgi:hypothetical protein